MEKSIIGYKEANKSRDFCVKVINDLNMSFDDDRQLIISIEGLIHKWKRG